MDFHALHYGDREAVKSLKVGGAERQANDILNTAKQQDKQLLIQYFAIVCLNCSASLSQQDVKEKRKRKITFVNECHFAATAHSQQRVPKPSARRNIFHMEIQIRQPVVNKHFG